MIDRKHHRLNRTDKRAIRLLSDRIDTCSKVRFSSAAKAWEAVERAYSWGRDEKNVYHCITCRGYHLTSQESRWLTRIAN